MLFVNIIIYQALSVPVLATFYVTLIMFALWGLAAYFGVDRVPATGPTFESAGVVRFLGSILTFLTPVGLLLLWSAKAQARDLHGRTVRNLLSVLSATMAYTVVSPVIQTYFLRGAVDDSLERFHGAALAAVCATVATSTLGSGARLAVNVVVSIVVGGVLYPLHAMWMWRDGWLQLIGVYDFAGGGVVLLLGGVAALSGAFATGSRIGWARVDPGGSSVLPLTATGSFFVVVGFSGMYLGVLGPQFPRLADGILSLFIASTAGALATGVSSWWTLVRSKRQRGGFSVFWIFQGLLGGAASWMALGNIFSGMLLNAALLGFAGGLASVGIGRLVTHFLGESDPINAVGIFGGGGLVGLVAAGLTDAGSVASQLVGASAILTTSGGSVILLCTLFGQMGWLRREPPERMGLGLEFMRTNATPSVNDVAFLQAVLASPLHRISNIASDLAGLATEPSVPSESINSLVDLLRQESLSLRQLAATEQQEVDLVPLVRELVQEYQANQPDVSLEVSSDAETVLVAGRDQLLKEAVRSLLENAVMSVKQRQVTEGRFAPRVRVIVSTGKKGWRTQAVIRICDNGVGIPAEFRAMLGEPFARGRSRGYGTGLGLFLARFVAESCGGRLALVSPPGQEGAEFEWV